MTVDTPLPLVGPGVTMRALAARAEELRRDVTRPVLVAGARGLGKQFLARRIHAASAHAAQPLLVVNGRTVAEVALKQLLDAAAPGATLLVRHVEQLSLPAQTLLDLRTGERSHISRLMATTTSDVIARVTDGTFLESLYYRLHAWPMLLPALAQREPDDLLALAHAVLVQTADGNEDLPAMLDAGATARLLAWKWPDNLRELEATLALAQLRARGMPRIDADKLPLPVALDLAPPADLSLADVERWHLLRVLAVHKGNRTHAARTLGISRMTLITKLKLFSDEGDA